MTVAPAPYRHPDPASIGWGVRAVTRVRSTADRSARQARREGLAAFVRSDGDGWYTVWTRKP
jgi:hypothetical protein